MTEHIDTNFSTPVTFIPIDENAMNGDEILGKAGPIYMRAVWTGTMWAYPHREWDEETQTLVPGRPWHQVDVEPTHYAKRD